MEQGNEGEEETLELLIERLRPLNAPARIEAAVAHFGDSLILSTSFGIQSAVMLHLATSVKPDMPVVFVDTGYLFAETYQFAEGLRERLNLNLKVYQPRVTAARFEALHGRLWEGGEEELRQYGLVHKVEPMNRALAELGAQAWMSGLRHAQASTRQNLQVVERQKRTWKIHPILEWSERDVYHYLVQHNLPYHPLWEKGYVSVGDWHSSQPLSAGLAPEQTRFNGVKRECGLHEVSAEPEYQI